MKYVPILLTIINLLYLLSKVICRVKLTSITSIFNSKYHKYLNFIQNNNYISENTTDYFLLNNFRNDFNVMIEYKMLNYDLLNVKILDEDSSKNWIVKGIR